MIRILLLLSLTHSHSTWKVCNVRKSGQLVISQTWNWKEIEKAAVTKRGWSWPLAPERDSWVFWWLRLKGQCAHCYQGKNISRLQVISFQNTVIQNILFGNKDLKNILTIQEDFIVTVAIVLKFAFNFPFLWFQLSWNLITQAKYWIFYIKFYEYLSVDKSTFNHSTRQVLLITQHEMNK